MSFTSRASEAPGILQLQKWGASELQLNLSQFREAFLSPTRELLLLLSYQCEALLLPLVKDEAATNNDHQGTFQNPCSLDSYSRKLVSSSRSDLQDNISITSETTEIDYSRSNDYPVLCDVNSLAWGKCADTYDQHEAPSFSEILLVSGNHGVTVHAFRQSADSDEATEFAQEGDSGGGKWVEWGPATALPHCSGVDKTERVREELDTSFLGAREDDSSRNITQKRWLHSFLTKVDTSKSKGYYWTRFPERSQYPSSAVAVSFGIFDRDSGVWRFLFDRTTNLHEKESFTDSDPSTGSFSYKCNKVFSSSTHDLLGFALTLMDPILVNTKNETEKNLRRFVLVARIGSWGIQWISLVKLDEYVNNVPMLEWADFGFSDKYLICLNAAGLLYLFGATTGDYVAHIDLSQICGFHPHFHSHEEETVQSDVVCSSDNIKAKGENTLSGQTEELVGKTVFRRLLVASDTLMLAVIDEYGVVYVIYTNDHIPGVTNSVEQSLPQFKRLGLGTMVGWEVGGAEISHQRPLSSPSPDIALVKHTSHFNNNIGNTELPKFQDGTKKKRVHAESFISGFTSPSQIVEKNFESREVPSRSMRSIFVPTERYAEDDIFFFSAFGITRLISKQKTVRNTCSQIVHFNLYVDSSINDDISSCSQGQRVSAGDAVGCIFQGCFYLVTKDALSIVLPSVSVSSDYVPIEAIGYRQTRINTSTAGHDWDLFEMQGLKQPWPPWKIEVLDRVLLYEGHEEADRLCSKNDWDVKISRMRRLQVALDYLKYEEIEISLEMLAGVSLAEEGILRLLFAAVYLMFDKVGNDNEVSAASRLLALATRFAIRMIRKYGLLQQRKNAFMSKGLRGMDDSYLPMLLSDKEYSEIENSRRLQEMAQFLETIRNLQCRLSSKYSRPAQRLVDGSGTLSLLDSDLAQDDAELSNPAINALMLETSNQQELSSVASDTNSSTKKLALMSVNSFDSKADSNLENSGGASVLGSERNVSGRVAFPFENPKDMIARWETDNLDQKNIVKDALLSGRLPLAVLKLHLRHLGDTITANEPHDTFSEVRDIGRAIAYDLFLKDETGLAVATLQKLGEDAESSLRQLVFGTVRRSLRGQVAEEMKRYGYLGPYDWKILEGISLIERVYPCCSFWRTYFARRNELVEAESLNSPEEIKLRLLHSPSDSVSIACGEIDGVVLGSWSNVSEHSSIPVLDDDSTHAFYWAAAAIWSDAWNQRTIDRIVLGQPFLTGVNILWESQLEYHICHNDWVEVSKLLDMIPSYSLSGGSLRISLEGLPSTSVAGCNREFRDYRNYVCSVEDLDAVCMDVLEIRKLSVSADIMCSMWLRTLMEKELAKKFIFLKEYWEDSTELVRLLAQSGFITNMSEVPYSYPLMDGSPELNISNSNVDSNPGALQGLHKLLVYHCSQYNLPNLLDLYLDHHKLALDNEALSSVQDAVGDSQWAKWLLLLRGKGNEYEASFSNARSIASHNLVPGNSIAGLEIDDLIRTVDDIAEGAGELAAIATLMYAPVPIQDCLSTGSVNRHRDSSAQCTLESLGPAIQRFPTLWRTLVAACFGQDPTCNYYSARTKVVGSSSLSDYLNWRDNIFYSAGHDTSLLQMLPGWFSKAVRRLIQLYVQGPLGWQSLAGLPVGESFVLRDIDYVVDGSDQGEISTMSWEAAIQKHVEEQLYGSSVEGSGLGLEQHLHRGRALAAFNHLLSVRVQKLKLEIWTNRGNSGSSAHVQSNLQSDVHTLLGPVVQNEEPLLSSVIPLAIMHFEDSVLVASCAFLLELCGLSASMLRLDIAALRRISSFYKSGDSTGRYGQLSPKDSAFQSTYLEGDITDCLARALADDYLKHDSMGIVNERDSPSNTSTKQPSRPLMLVLQHLEKASLPMIVGGTTCGSWLMNGNGDGTELRAQQKAASQHWNLVTAFCRMHQIPLSTKYLTALARDNDWVGFLSEAQVGGYPFETTIQVASKEFNDPRLKVHISTVLKAMQSRKNAVSSSSLDSAEKRSECSILEEKSYIPIELFGIIADCEKQIRPGEALLLKAKDLCWSVLAMIASCFPDVSPLSCLTVWLEITAARETSSIKVNDIASLIANNVGAAVEATNLMSVSGRPHALHYNRRNSKRRRLLESATVDILTSKISDVSTTSSAASIFASNNINAEDEIEKHATQSTSGTEEATQSLSKMVAVLCEQRLFLPLLRAFEMFLPSCSLLPFIRALQAFSQMRLSEASVHLGSFSSRIKEESLNLQTNTGREGFTGTSWISSTAVKASDAMLSTCPSPYERRCLLQLLIATDFGDGGSAMAYYRRLYWKINLAEPSLRKDDGLQLGNESLDDASLLEALEMNGHWEQARNWARQLEASGGSWKSAAQHVTEKQAESMVAEWKEFLWDVPEERVALWSHCQTLFLRYSFPALQAGLFFLRHAEAVEKDLPARELHELLLLALQWLSGMITQSTPVYPLHLLREIETRAWLLAVESEAQVKSDGDMPLANSNRDSGTGKSSSIIDRTASIISKMDNHINTMRSKVEKNDARDYNFSLPKNSQVMDASFTNISGGSSKLKRRTKGFVTSRRPLIDTVEKNTDSDDGLFPLHTRPDTHVQDENTKMDISLSRWEESIGPTELERAVLSLLEFGQITAARQLQHKLSPAHIPSEFVIVDAALKLATASTPSGTVAISMLDEEVRSVIKSYNLPAAHHFTDPMQVLESLISIFTEGRGRGLCRRILAVVKAANVLGLSFSEAFDKQPVELLQLLSLKAQDSFEEAYLLVQTHSMPAASVAQILAESFLKGLLAAHRGGYIDSQKEEGPAPLLWRFSDFLTWAELCPSEPEVGHALMRLVITGQEIPHACEVELLILSHHFYKSSACLDGVDVLVALAATRVEAYVSEGDFPCLARLITGVGNFHALNFILGILIENGQLDLLLQKYSAAADANAGTAEAVRGFRMAVLTSLKQFNPNDLDAFAMVYNHFDMKHETASLLESRAEQSAKAWLLRYDKDQNEDLLESMRYYIEAAEVHSSIDAGNKTRAACAQASLVSLQIRMPDIQWLNLSATNARRVLVEQSRFQEALIVAEAYGLNQPGEWALVLWNQMLKPELTEQFVEEFVSVLPLQPTMLAELARFYRAEVAARGDQSQFSVWLTGGGLPAEWAKYLGRSFRCLLKRTRDLRLRLQLATIATGFVDVIDACAKALDRVPDNGGPLVLRKGHGGAYLPLM